MTVGNDIYLLVGHDAVGSETSATDNLGNTYYLIHVYDGPPKCVITRSRQALWRAKVTNAGTLTSQTATWNSSSIGGGAAASIEIVGPVTTANGLDCNGLATSASITTAAVSGVLLWTIALRPADAAVTGYTPPTGYTNAWFVGATGSLQAGVAFDYLVGTASGTLTASWTNNAEFTLKHTQVTDTPLFVPQIIRTVYALR